MLVMECRMSRDVVGVRSWRREVEREVRIVASTAEDEKGGLVSNGNMEWEADGRRYIQSYRSSRQ